MNRTQAHLQRLGGLFYNVYAPTRAPDFKYFRPLPPPSSASCRCPRCRGRGPLPASTAPASQLLVRRARGARATAAGKPGALGQDRRRKGDHRPLHTALWSSFRRPLFRLGANNAGSEC
ncbi:hypothetical protein PAHAL_2G327300 [Panicum hallii]|uniref:Uncharacterized protein n=1 Tax=Panicum hallii TaxID=206008 RepID=A0A2T8KR71_9POAL|nr:hypothetical protein PAHAL_2G327300 [Panicum hallii]